MQPFASPPYCVGRTGAVGEIVAAGAGLVATRRGMGFAAAFPRCPAYRP